ncbi:recombination mediator RecR [Dietzia sp.]|uniref:recombination mediator RecR n=1 Tax=Dietzia sp. TaxID=1871616 RepID=UPI002FD9C139
MYEGPVQNLIDELEKLPGIGPKSAQRIAFHLLQVEPEDIERLQSSLGSILSGVTYCEVCGTVSAEKRCRICSDPRRDLSLVCVVEEPKDVQAIERTKEYSGVYHVLGGSLDPINGIGPDQLRISQLLRRVAGSTPEAATESETADGAEAPEPVEVGEVIIATDPNTTGEATASYLVRLLRDFPGLTISRLASGLPMGGDLEFADEITLGHALSGRRVLSQSKGA